MIFNKIYSVKQIAGLRKTQDNVYLYYTVHRCYVYNLTCTAARLRITFLLQCHIQYVHLFINILWFIIL